MPHGGHGGWRSIAPRSATRRSCATRGQRGLGDDGTGPAALDLNSGALPEGSVHRLKTKFSKTELELGHRLRRPSDGPCERDLPDLRQARHHARVRDAAAEERRLSALSHHPQCRGLPRSRLRPRLRAAALAVSPQRVHRRACPYLAPRTRRGELGARLLQCRVRSRGMYLRHRQPARWAGAVFRCHGHDPTGAHRQNPASGRAISL